MFDVPLGLLLPTLGLIAVLCLAMVWVMVRFSAAMVGRRPGEGPGDALEPDSGSGARRLGLVYLLLWAGIIAAFLHLMRLSGAPLGGRNLALLLLVAGGWLAFNAAWIGLVRALMRADERAAEDAASGESGEEEEEDPHGRLAGERVAAEIRDAGRRRAGEDGESPIAETPSAETPSTGRPPWLKGLLLLGTLVAALVVIGIGEAIPALAELTARIAEHQARFLVPVVALGVLGFALFMGGTIWLVLARGRPLDLREIEELEARGMLAGGAHAGGARYRHEGPARGARAGEEVSFAEIKIAVAARAWQFSARWRRLFLILTGAVLLGLGILGVVFVLAPAGVKLLIALVALYAAARTAIGLVRA